MKKILFSIFSCMLFSAVSAQIPNAGFESWTTVGSYEVPNGWGTLNNTTTGFGVYTATKATPGNPGSYYMKLTSKTIGTVVVNGIAVSGQIDSMTMQPKSGFPFMQRPANFTGKWQHMIYGTSQGSLIAKLTRWDTGLNQRVTVGTASVTLSGMAMSWANFTLPFTYADGGYPDTCIIVLKASGSAPTDQDYLWVDNLAFTGSVAGVQNNASIINSVTVYPNPAQHYISVDLNLKSPRSAGVEMIDITGKTVLTKKVELSEGLNKLTVDITGFSKGSYFLRVTTTEGSGVKKIVIE